MRVRSSVVVNFELAQVIYKGPGGGTAVKARLAAFSGIGHDDATVTRIIPTVVGAVFDKTRSGSFVVYAGFFLIV